MAYDESLADRLRGALSDRSGYAEKQMFGAIGFLLAGNFAVGVTGDSLIVRVGPEAYAEALADPVAVQFAPAGRPMTGWVLVSADGILGESDLLDWLDLGWEFAASLPPKPGQ